MNAFHETNPTKILHRIACVVGTLVTAYCLLRVGLTFATANDDFQKYGGLGSPNPLEYYWKENGLAESIITFLLVFFEFLMYLHICRCRNADGILWRKRYILAMLAIHAALQITGHFLWAYHAFPDRTAEKVILYIRGFANVSILPSVLYSAAILSQKHSP